MAKNLQTICQDFAVSAASVLHIQTEKDYQKAIDLVETLLEQAQDNGLDPLNAIIQMVSHAIEEYENQDKSIQKFEKRVLQNHDGLSMLRLLMDQHQLRGADLPEIGSKYLVSKILACERSLTKNHIQALCERFHISPELFFDAIKTTKKQVSTKTGIKAIKKSATKETLSISDRVNSPSHVPDKATKNKKQSRKRLAH